MYYILEIQAYNDGTSAHIMYTEQTEAQAESKYHTVLAYAAISDIPIHVVMILTFDGNLVKRETYYHTPEVVEEVENSNE